MGAISIHLINNILPPVNDMGIIGTRLRTSVRHLICNSIPMSSKKISLLLAAGLLLGVPGISQGSVAGFLAWPGEAEPIGNNIKVMWFQRVNGEWQSYG